METDKIKQRKAFVDSYVSGHWSMSELCEHFGVSRPTGYLWASRFDPEDLKSLQDRSCAPKHHGNQADPLTVEWFLWARDEYGWGAKKLRWKLERDHPDVYAPARSTINAILDRNGLLRKRRGRRRWLHPGAVPLETDHPNQVWPIDFKGHFKTRDGVYCYPLTVTDHCSRELRACHALPVLCLDPAVKSWLPPQVINLLRPVLRTIVLAGMREPEQRARAAATINSSVLWKWRKSAIQMRNLNLFDHLAQVRQKTCVLNGSHDRFHDSAVFPAVADAISDGVFVRVPVGEDKRERLFGAIATVFASSDAGPEIPPALREFIVPRDPDRTTPTG